jgi:hypothetical protein
MAARNSKFGEIIIVFYVTVLSITDNSHRRYWEDSLSEEVIKPVEGELNNHPGTGRIERVTHDDNFRNDNVVVSDSDE